MYRELLYFFPNSFIKLLPGYTKNDLHMLMLTDVLLHAAEVTGDHEVTLNFSSDGEKEQAAHHIKTGIDSLCDFLGVKEISLAAYGEFHQEKLKAATRYSEHDMNNPKVIDAILRKALEGFKKRNHLAERSGKTEEQRLEEINREQKHIWLSRGGRSQSAGFNNLNI